MTVIFGVNPVREKLRARPEEVREILMAGEPRRGALRGIGEEARRCGLRIRYVSPEALDRLAGTDKHQGVVAEVAPFVYLSFDDLLRDLALEPAWILCLDGLTDPRNFGALLRTAEAVGLVHIVVPKDRSAGVTGTVVKASAGAVHYQRIYRVPNLGRVLAAAKDRSYWVVGLDAGAPESIYDRTYPEKLAIVLGSEGAGIRPLIKRECDFLVSIPMVGEVSSLNVAVAGAVFLYEVLRRRSLSGHLR